MPLEALCWVDDLDQEHIVTGAQGYRGSPVARHADQPKAGRAVRTWSAKNVSTRRQESAAAVGS